MIDNNPVKYISFHVTAKEVDVVSHNVYTKSMKNIPCAMVNYESNGSFTWILLV